MDAGLVDRVLAVVELIPPGRTASYGTVGMVAGCGPRLVGRILSRHGDGVAWWRVTSAAGEFPPNLLARADPHWDAEGIALAASGRGCARVQRMDAGALRALDRS